MDEKFEHELLDSETSVPEAKARVADEVLKRTPQQQITTTESGMSRREQEQYSIRKAILAADPRNTVACLEREISDSLRKELSGRVQGLGNGILIPTQQKRAITGLDTITAGAGHETVATEFLSIIEILRKNLLARGLGIRTLTGLQGDVKIPRVTGRVASS
jgi:hypothetical protein